MNLRVCRQKPTFISPNSLTHPMYVYHPTLVAEKQQDTRSAWNTQSYLVHLLSKRNGLIFDYRWEPRGTPAGQNSSISLTKVTILSSGMGDYQPEGACRVCIIPWASVASHQFLGPRSIDVLRERQRDREITLTSSSFFQTPTMQSFSWKNEYQTTVGSHYLL